MAEKFIFIGIGLVIVAIVGGNAEATGLVKLPPLKRSQAIIVGIVGALLAIGGGLGKLFPTGVENVISSRQQEQHLELCTGKVGPCTLFLFDYNYDGADAIGASEFSNFQDTQLSRFQNDIRAHLRQKELLSDVDFRVERCSAVKVPARANAEEIARRLKAPAVVWGHIERRGGKYSLATSLTLTCEPLVTLNADEKLGESLMELRGDERQLSGPPLAVGAFVVGEEHRRKGRHDLARIAFHNAREKLAGVGRVDDFLEVIDARLKELEKTNPAADLTVIGATP